MGGGGWRLIRNVASHATRGLGKMEKSSVRDDEKLTFVEGRGWSLTPTPLYFQNCWVTSNISLFQMLVATERSALQATLLPPTNSGTGV